MNTRIQRYLLPVPVALFFVLLLNMQNGQAQPFSPGTPEILIESESRYFMSPKWSPDGSKIAFTSGEYRGLWTATADGNEIEQLSPDESAGYGFSWSSNGSSILSRTASYEDRHRLHAIKRFDVETKTEHVLKDYTRERTGVPQWTDMDQRVAVPMRESIEMLESGIEPANRQKRLLDEAVLISRDTKIEKSPVSDEQPEVVVDLEDRRILNITPSPDGSVIAFQVIGEGLFLIDADGSNLCELGRGEDPTWTPDGEYLIAVITEDDGHHITGSEVFAIEISTGERHHLTSHTDLIALQPTVSPDGNRIAFTDSETGHIYSMSIR